MGYITSNALLPAYENMGRGYEDKRQQSPSRMSSGV